MTMHNHYLVIDAGNTNTEVGLYSDEGLICSWRISSDIDRTEDELFSIINGLAAHRGVPLRGVNVCCIASVVPELTRIYNHIFEKYFDSNNLITISSSSNLGLKFPTEDYSYIGADLLVNAYSARYKYKTNVIIVDFGTATTVQLVDINGLFYGTTISPGIKISSANLFQKASLLSKIKLEPPNEILGTNTKDSLLSGIVRGHCYMVDSFVRNIKKRYDYLKEFKVIATGGIAHLLKAFLEEVDTVDKTLTIDGLYYYCRQNSSKE